jgi:hypothetical protein
MLAACAVLGLLGCGNEPVAENIAESAKSAQPMAESRDPTTTNAARPPDADANASREPGGTLPPADRPLRFVGRWAVEERLCPTTAWRFTESALNTPAGSVCRFTAVRDVPGGYDISARCTAEAPERDDVLKVRFAESARAMLFESESIADAGLVYCGE